MANTVTTVSNLALGNKNGVVADVAISSYTEGGETLAAGHFGLKCIEQLVILTPCNGYAIFGTAAGGKVTAYAEATLEAADTADCGTVRVLAVGY